MPTMSTRLESEFKNILNMEKLCVLKIQTEDITSDVETLFFSQCDISERNAF